MDYVFKYAEGFLSGLFGLLMSILPIAILFQVLTGGVVFGMDVIGNISTIISYIGNGGFVGLVTLVVVMSFFANPKKTKK